MALISISAISADLHGMSPAAGHSEGPKRGQENVRLDVSSIPARPAIHNPAKWRAFDRGAAIPRSLFGLKPK
jgi:hypothetical protein